MKQKKVCLITQRPIQSIISMYELKKINFEFEYIIFFNSINKKVHKEDLYGLSALKFQCNLLNIPLLILKKFNYKKILEFKKKFKSKLAISLVTDYLFEKKFLDEYSGGIYGFHLGPFTFPGLFSNYKAFSQKNKFAEINFFKLQEKIDFGRPLFNKKIKISKKSNIKMINEFFFYNYKFSFIKKFIIKHLK
jgi:hypothetical protein